MLLRWVFDCFRCGHAEIRTPNMDTCYLWGYVLDVDVFNSLKVVVFVHEHAFGNELFHDF